ncbi:MAG: pirin family protein [Chitinivibrionales bacterium]|nr:pirin family protein [Chitinivibrionales bacterium]
MTKTRKIKKVFRSKPTIEGAGVHLHRAFGNSEVPLFDPFLLLDDFRSDEPRHFLKGFPWHPHRGIETITYVLAGDVEHGDSMGNKGVIGSGDVQWMTAGSGIIHQEMPKGDSKGRMYGFQLWANLPASHKMMDPRYRGLLASEIPAVTVAGGATIKVIAGNVNGTVGPVQDIVTDPQYLDITLPAGSEFTHATVAGHTVFAYVIEGNALFCKGKDPFSYELEGANYFDFKQDPHLSNGTLALFDDGKQLSITTEKDPVRFLLVSGKPIGEPVAWYGPIVMNTRQELQIAFDEFNSGAFIKHKAQS